MKDIILVKIRSSYIDKSDRPWDFYKKFVYSKEELEESIKKFEAKKEKIIDQKKKELEHIVLKAWDEKAEKLANEIDLLKHSKIVYYEFSKEEILEIVASETIKYEL